MRVLVPFDVRDPNTRLSSVFDTTQRREFAARMRTDVVETITEAGHQPELLATHPIDVACPVHIDDRPLTEAVNAVLAKASDPVAVVMADLALVTPDSLATLFEPDTEIVLAPGLGGGTNAIVVRNSEFRVDYHGGSYRKHRRNAEACDGSVETVDSFRLAVDIDEPDDLVELLLHGSGEAASWLREAGFGLDTTGGRCELEHS